MERKHVVPGQYLGTEEEFISGEYTYEDNGNIYSSNLGEMDVGSDYRVRVKGGKQEIFVQPGDEIIGVISEINEPIVVVSGEYIVKNGNILELKTRALIHASRVTGHYLDQCSKVLKVRDVVVGKVVSTRGKIDLSLEAPDDGVIYANCSRCRKYLEKINSGLYCTYCQRSEIRKVSRRYGEFSLEKKR